MRINADRDPLGLLPDPGREDVARKGRRRIRSRAEGTPERDEHAHTGRKAASPSLDLSSLPTLPLPPPLPSTPTQTSGRCKAIAFIVLFSYVFFLIHFSKFLTSLSLLSFLLFRFLPHSFSSFGSQFILAYWQREGVVARSPEIHHHPLPRLPFSFNSIAFYYFCSYHHHHPYVVTTFIDIVGVLLLFCACFCLSSFSCVSSAFPVPRRTQLSRRPTKRGAEAAWPTAVLTFFFYLSLSLAFLFSLSDREVRVSDRPASREVSSGRVRCPPFTRKKQRKQTRFVVTPLMCF